MSTSFISYKDNGFWAKDGFVEAFQLLLFEEINRQYNNNISWLNDYKKELALQSLPLIYGGMSMCLNETLTDPDRTAIIVQLIDNIESKISADKDYLTGRHLNALRRTVREHLVAEKEFEWDDREIEKELKDGGYGKELPVSNYLKAFELLRMLTTGQMTYKVDSPITYW